MKNTQLTYEVYYNKVLGGWIGKFAGGILGAPIEGFKSFNNIEISEKLFETNFPNDDLDLQVLWLDMVTKKGPLVDETDLREHWLRHVQFPFAEYGIALRNMKAGLDIPNTGSHNNHYWYRGMGSPIRSEIWGMLCPGDPESAMRYAKIDSQLDHNGFSVEAEMFLSAAAAIAFFESDIKTTLLKALELFEKDSAVRNLVEKVMVWNDSYSSDVVAGKIKSRFGDADFTSSPQNVAFTILALLISDNALDGIVTALHFGHDSDCVVATAGALLGIIIGYDKIPELWKTRVGDELLVSPEIVDLDHSDTVTGLAKQTCKAGISFIEHYGKIALLHDEEPFDTRIEPLSVRAQVMDFPHLFSAKNGRIEIILSNRTNSKMNDCEVKMSSPYFESATARQNIEALSNSKLEMELIWKKSIAQNSSTFSFHYTIEVQAGSEKYKAEKGMPNYGSWKLLGPFIKDDTNLVPMHEEYPDHGLDSMPSFNYMNRDKLNLQEDFIDLPTIIELNKKGELDSQPFDVQTIAPTGFKVDLNQYYIGRGERTLYLYTTIEAPEEVSSWLTIGCSAYFKVWHNEQKVLDVREIIRSWPYAQFTLLNFKKGINHILIKIDNPTDHLDFEIGLKEFKGRHPHQSQWDTELIFNV